MQPQPAAVHPPIVARLRAALECPVIGPGDAGYDTGRALYFTAFDRHPAAIVRPADARDVARAILVARETGLPLSVKGGGHSGCGFGVVDGGVALDLGGLDTLDIDAGARVAHAGGGLTAGAYTVAAGAHGLATGFGDAPSVGIGGITLAGGIGFLHRRDGLTIDNLLGAELVTADGRVRYVDAETEPDLFWAIRGGGGNFGVVTRFHLRLHPVDTVLGGMLFVPATPERLVSFFELALAAPDELSLIFAAMPAPPMPFIPAQLRGRPVIMALPVYAGPIAAGEAALAPFRRDAAADLIQPMRYPQVYEGHEQAPHPVAVALHTTFIDSLDLATAALLLERLLEGTAPMRVAQFRPLGGAVARVSAEATSFAHRSRACLVNLAAAFNDPAEHAQHQAWTGQLAAVLPPDAGGAYSAFLGTDGAARIREAYPGATWARLARLKAQYDPDNVFRANHNILPRR